MIHSNFPVNAVYQWSRGPEEAILYVDLRDQLNLPDEQMKEQVRARLSREMPDVRFSFEPSDIVNEVMSFGSPTPIEVVVSGSDFAKNREFAEKLASISDGARIARHSTWSVDGLPHSANQCRSRESRPSRLMPVDVSRALVTATSSSRFVVPITGLIQKAGSPIKFKWKSRAL